MKKSNSQYLEEVKQKTIEAGHLTPEFFTLYQDILKAQENFINKLNQLILKINLKSIEWPALIPSNLKFSKELNDLLNQELLHLTEIIKIAQPGLKLETLTQTLTDSKFSYQDLAKLILEKNFNKINQEASNLKIGGDEFFFIIVNLLKPIFISLKERYDWPKLDWDQPLCPFCHHYPDMNKIVESLDNKSFLHCSLCEHEWEFKRITCPICENSDHESLGYYSSNEISLYRINYCKKCQGYIKTIKIPKSESESNFNLTVENIITTFLDASALDLGYQRP